MAEIVGLVSAIAALATLSFRLANGILTIADDLGTIGAQLRPVAVDTKAVALVLHELKKHLKSTTNVTKTALDVAHEIIAQCQADIEDLDSCIKPFFVKDDEKKTLSWMRRVQWLFAKSKLATRRAALDSLKLTINMFIAALGFMDGDETEEYMQIEMKHMVAQCKNTKGAFLDAERHDRVLEDTFSAFQDSSGDLLLDVNTEDDSSTCKSEFLDVDGSTASLARTSDTELSDRTLWKRPQVNDKDTRATDFQVIETISDDQLVKIGEHLRIQKIASSFALVALSKGSTTPRDDSASLRQSAFKPANRPIPRHDQDKSPAPSSADEADAESTRNSTLLNGSEDEESAEEPPPRQTASSRRKEKTRQSNYSQSANASKKPKAQRSHSNTNPEGSYPATDTRYTYRPQEYFYSPYNQMPFANGEPSIHHQGRRQYYPDPSQQGYGYQFPMYSPMGSPSPNFPPEARQQPDPERLRLEEQIRAFKEHQEKAEAAEKQNQIAMEARRDAEEALARRMEEMRSAQEEAQREIERAKAEAERAARERIEEERKAEEERQAQHAEAMHRAEERARLKFEAELRAAEDRRHRDEEARARAEETARVRLEVAIRKEEEARAAAQREIAAEAERLRQIEADAKHKAEAEAQAMAQKQSKNVFKRIFS